MPDRLKEAFLSAAVVLTSSAVGAVILGIMWVAVGWLRFFGLETGLHPEALPLESIDYHDQVLNVIASAIDSYNCTFQGNSRFGSGLGLIAGACVGLTLCHHIRWRNRSAIQFSSSYTVAALIAGALVGARISLTFTSDPLPFIVISLLSSLCFAVLSVLSRNTLTAIPARDHWEGV